MVIVLPFENLTILVHCSYVDIIAKFEIADNLLVKRIAFRLRIGEHRPHPVIAKQVVSFVPTDESVSERIQSQIPRAL